MCVHRSGLVTFIAAYHYLRIFNSWTEGARSVFNSGRCTRLTHVCVLSAAYEFLQQQQLEQQQEQQHQELLVDALKKAEDNMEMQAKKQRAAKQNADPKVVERTRSSTQDLLFPPQPLPRYLSHATQARATPPTSRRDRHKQAPLP